MARLQTARRALSSPNSSLLLRRPCEAQRILSRSHKSDISYQLQDSTVLPRTAAKSHNAAQKRRMTTSISSKQPPNTGEQHYHNKTFSQSTPPPENKVDYKWIIEALRTNPRVRYVVISAILLGMAVESSFWYFVGWRWLFPEAVAVESEKGSTTTERER